MRCNFQAACNETPSFNNTNYKSLVFFLHQVYIQPEKQSLYGNNMIFNCSHYWASQHNDPGIISKNIAQFTHLVHVSSELMKTI